MGTLSFLDTANEVVILSQTFSFIFLFDMLHRRKAWMRSISYEIFPMRRIAQRKYSKFNLYSENVGPIKVKSDTLHPFSWAQISFNKRPIEIIHQRLFIEKDQKSIIFSQTHHRVSSIHVMFHHISCPNHHRKNKF